MKGDLTLGPMAVAMLLQTGDVAVVKAVIDYRATGKEPEGLDVWPVILAEETERQRLSAVRSAAGKAGGFAKANAMANKILPKQILANSGKIWQNLAKSGKIQQTAPHAPAYSGDGDASTTGSENNPVVPEDRREIYKEKKEDTLRTPSGCGARRASAPAPALTCEDAPDSSEPLELAADPLPSPEAPVLSPELAPPPPPSFDDFWAEYPRKTDRKRAQEKFLLLVRDRVITPANFPDILAALRRQKGSDQWTRDGGAFVPHPTTWLNGRRWEDELPSAAPAFTRSGNSPVAEQFRNNYDFAKLGI